MISEVLKLNEHLFAPLMSDCLHEFFDEFFVFFSLDSGKLDSRVHWVVEQFFIVGSDIDLFNKMFSKPVYN